MQDNLIFSAAVENGCEKLFEVVSGDRVSYLLRTESMILGAHGEELWDSRERGFVHNLEYLDHAHDRMPFFTPLELNPKYREVFRVRLLRAAKNMGLQAERSLFNHGTGYCKWMYWRKVLGDGQTDLESPEIIVRNFIRDEPVDSMALRLRSVRSLQGLLDRIYQGMLSGYFRSGTYGRDWALYNLTRAKLVGKMERAEKPLCNAMREGDELTVLRMA